MNGTTARALVEDAFQQVLDNRIFRLLLIVIFGIVAAFFLIGFREDGIHVLYGWRTIAYDDLLRTVGLSSDAVSEPRASTIQFVESLLIENLAGNMAMVFCISATAFFVPRMLEKGSADTFFSKPLSRTTLLLSRWFAGLLFVAILATVLLSGIWLGLLVVSGWNDPGLLWGVVTLVYLYGIVHAFSTLIGVLTRSTVAAILLSLLLFMGSGCTHTLWRFFEFNHETQFMKRMLREASGQGESGEEAPQEASADAGSDVVDVFARVVAPIHYVLPKTSDADVLTRKLRRAIVGGPVNLYDEEGSLTVRNALDDFELRSPARAGVRGDVLPADLDTEPAVWEALEEGRVVARIEIRRESRTEDGGADEATSARKKPRRISTNAAADRVGERLREASPQATEPSSRKGMVAGVYAVFLTWSDDEATPRRARQAIVFTLGDWLYEIRVEAEPAWAGPEFRAQNSEGFLRRIRVGSGVEALDPARWYEKQFGWTARWKYNAFFSIGTSLAFVLVMLAWASWKLGRVDL